MAKSLCGNCGTCQRCKNAAYMREWYQRPGNAERQRESARKSRQRRIESVRAYDRMRSDRDFEKRAALRRKWQQENRERANELHRQWAERNPEKRAAHIVVGNAIRDGRLEREPCEVCGAKAQAHHEDYTKPFEVRWLCTRHHGAVHRMVA